MQNPSRGHATGRIRARLIEVAATAGGTVVRNGHQGYFPFISGFARTTAKKPKAFLDLKIVIFF